MSSWRCSSATASSCYSSQYSNVTQYPPSGVRVDTVTELGQSRSPMHIQLSSVCPIGHLSFCRYLSSPILILDLSRRSMLGGSSLLAPGTSQNTILNRQGLLVAHLPMNSASIATLARFAYIHHLLDPRELLLHNGLVITSHLEVGVAITASSVATLRPLLIRLKVIHSSHTQRQEAIPRYSNGNNLGGRRDC